MKNYLILLAGVIGAASSVFFIKESHLAPATLSAVRLFGSAIILLPFALSHLRAAHVAPRWNSLLIVLPAAFALAIHYPTWFIGVRETSAAMSTLIVNVVPVFMPFFIWMLTRERINRGETIGSVVALAGIVVLVLSKDDSGQNSLFGVLVCIGSIALCALYLAFGRKFGRGRHILAYIVPLYFAAGFLSLLGAIALRETLPPLTTREVLVNLGAIVFPTVIGHTALNYAMVHLPTQVVSISSLGQFVFVAIMAIPIRGEYPGWNLVVPAILVIAGSLIVIRSATPQVADKLKVATTEPAGT